MLTRFSYIVYIALLCVYLILDIFFFPETRGLSIEEVSLIFDTSRLRDASVATAELQAYTGKGIEEESSVIKTEDKVA